MVQAMNLGPTIKAPTMHQAVNLESAGVPFVEWLSGKDRCIIGFYYQPAGYTFSNRSSLHGR